MYGVAMNNVAESVANVSKLNSIPMSILPIAIGIWINCAMKTVLALVAQTKPIITQKIFIQTLPIGVLLRIKIMIDDRQNGKTQYPSTQTD